jgi:hypothetical protein
VVIKARVGVAGSENSSVLRTDNPLVQFISAGGLSNQNLAVLNETNLTLSDICGFKMLCQLVLITL